jgi:hypothetical protein
VHGQPILIAVDSDSMKGEFMGSSEDTNWDFSTVCHCNMSVRLDENTVGS